MRVFDLDLEIYMVKVSYHQKPYRRIIIENFGADVYASPSDCTNAGRAALEQEPNSPGSLRLATPALATAAIAGASVSEAVEVAAASGGTKKYSLVCWLPGTATCLTSMRESFIRPLFWPALA